MTKRLYKSQTNKQVSGVLAGIAEYFDIDPTVIRIAYVLLTVFTGIFPGILAYIILAIITPAENKEKKNGKKGR